MHTHSSHKHGSKSSANANSMASQQPAGTLVSGQEGLKKSISESPHVKQLKTYQQMADAYLQARRLQSQSGLAAQSGDVVQRLAIGAVEEYDGYLNGDGMIRNRANVGYFVGLLRAGLPLPVDDDPITAAKDVEMVATPDDDAQYMNAEECEEGDGRERVRKNVLSTGHHRVAAYAEMGMAVPGVGDADYAMFGYHWSKVDGADYELQEEDIFVPPVAEQQHGAEVPQAQALGGQQQQGEVLQDHVAEVQEDAMPHAEAIHHQDVVAAVEGPPVMADQPFAIWMQDIRQRFAIEYANDDIRWGNFDAPFAPGYEQGLSSLEFYNQYIRDWAFME